MKTHNKNNLFILGMFLIGLAVYANPQIASFLGAQSFYIQVDIGEIEGPGGDDIDNVQTTSESIQGVFVDEDDEVDDPPLPSAADVVVTPVSATLLPGETQQFAATITVEGSPTDVTGDATWNSSQSSIASINSSGLLTASQPGTTNITAEYDSSLSNTAVTTVLEEEGTYKVEPNLRGNHPQGGGQNLSTLVTLDFRNPITKTSILKINNARTSDSGTGFDTLPPNGTYDIIVEGASHLTRVYTGITVIDGVATDLTGKQLIFGEVGSARDGQVTISDLTAVTGPIIANSPSTPQYNRPNFRTGSETLSAEDLALEKVDANGDGAITIADITGVITPLIENTQAETY